MTEIDPIELSDLAAQAKRYFGWGIALLLAAACILVLDLQIKRSLARQAVATSETLSRAEGLARGRATPDVATAPHDSGVSGGGSGDAVDGSTPVAEGTDPVRGPKPPRGRGVAQRPEGDGP